MILDTAAVVIKLSEKWDPEKEEIYWEESFVDEGKGCLVFCGAGAAKDVQLAEAEAERLNNSYGNSFRRYEVIRMDVEDCLKKGVL